MSEYSVKEIKSSIKYQEESIKDDLKAIEKIKKDIVKLRKAGVDLTYDSVERLKTEVFSTRECIRESKATIRKYQKALPAAIKYEKEHPESKDDNWEERKRRLHLNNIRKKAIVMSKAKALANRIEKLTGLRAHAYPDFNECKASINISASLVNLNKAKKLIKELADAKVTARRRVPLVGRKNRFVIRGYIHLEVV